MKKLFLLSFLFLASTNFVLGQAANGENNAIEDMDNGSAIGYGTMSRGSYSFAAGYQSRAVANGSFAFGRNATAENQFSFALGSSVVTGADYAWIIGSGYSGFGGISQVANSISNSLFVGFNTKGTPSLFVKPFGSNGLSDGYVGIHTNTPTSHLDVNGVTTTNSLVIDGNERPFIMTEGRSDGYVLTCDANGVGSWQPNNSSGGGEDCPWDSNGQHIYYANSFGNVGIGPSSSNPQERLHVFGNLRIDGYLRGGEPSGALKAQTKSGYVNIGPTNSSWAHIYTDRPKFVFNKDIYTSTGGFSSYYGGNLILKTGGSTKMTILHSNGNVGIGTTTPTGKLHVFGEIKSNDYYQFDQAAGEIRYGKADLSSSFKIKRYKSGDASSGKSTNPDYWKDVLVIDNEERIGIGTDSPTEKLDVAGTTKTEGLQVTGGSLGSNYILTDVNGDGNASWVDPGTISGIGVWDVTNDVAHYSSKVAVNTNYVPDGFEFAVNGDILCEKIEVRIESNWPDYVFEEDYKLPELSEIELYVKEYKHLEGVPSAETVAKEGIELGEMNAILLQKIEELTLLMIEQQKSIESQQKEINTLKEQVNQK